MPRGGGSATGGNRSGPAGVKHHMGHADAVHLDVDAVRAMAREYETAASILDAAVRTLLSNRAFGGDCAGRAYVADGIALREALDAVVVALRRWARAAGDIAVTLRSSIVGYQDADAGSAARLG